MIIKSAHDRKTAYVFALHNIIEHARLALVEAEKIDPLDIATGEAAYVALREVNRKWDGCFQMLVGTFFPKGSEMNVHLRSINYTNPVKFGEGDASHHGISYTNLASDKYSRIFICSFLEWDTNYTGATKTKSDREKIIRRDAINSQLAKLK